MKRFVKLLPTSLIAFLLLAPFLWHVSAQGWVGEGFGTGVDAGKTGGEINKEADIDDTTQKQMLSVACGIVVKKGADYCTNNEQVYNQMQKKTAIAMIDRYISDMYANPPADIALWTQDTAHTLGFAAKPAYAQGIGFSGLSALLPLWKAFRNIAYGLVAVALVVVGFMVMFRKKIDPQTVVTVQNSLPRIVITLLLITFSYAIVGIMIDIMYFAFLLFMNVIVSVSNGIFDENYTRMMLTESFPKTVGLVGRGLRATDDIVRVLNPGAATTQLDFSSAEAGAGSIGTAIATGLVGGIEGALLFVVLGLILLFATIRIFFMLIGAYIQIIISLITAPFQILIEIFPGSNGFTSWLQNLIAHLLVFPLTALFLTLGEFLARQGTGVSTSGLGSSGPRIWDPPLVGAYGSTGMLGLLGLGILLAIPTMVNGAKEALKAKPVPLLGAGGGGGGAKSMQLISTLFYLRQMTPAWLLDRVGIKQSAGGKEH